ncbi:hypothetical protein BLAT2472_110105 [Burkholderia latens]
MAVQARGQHDAVSTGGAASPDIKHGGQRTIKSNHVRYFDPRPRSRDQFLARTLAVERRRTQTLRRG